ncbi:MAG TPA: hypothetical protein PLL77_16195 [Pyrinomonadaceae bacterium]|nr:hypothetical protein [Pyrinomonadaceae bacterium]
MEILNSGSFIPLDNREKIEQLIFTARTLANEVSQNEGFQSSGQTNQQIGLELWKGAEYMTRSHEEVTILNIFLSKFLERLRDIDREAVQRSSTPIPHPIQRVVENTAPIGPPISAESRADIRNESVQAKDEFLGIVDSEELVVERPSYANECKPECEEEIVSMLDSSEDFSNVEPTAEPRVEQNSTPTPALNVEDEEVKEHDGAKVASKVESVTEPTTSKEEIDDSASDCTITPEQSVRSVVLSEKEPYNFCTCTVTAVIQLLPESNGSRDCIISVRSHDFAPLITFTNLCNESGELNLSDPISAALEQYRNSLPLLAAEKMKKEQAATKKRSPKTVAKSPNKTPEQAVTSSDTNSTSSAIQSEPAKDQQSLFAS